MNNEQVKERFQKLVERYGCELPDHTQEPRRFEYYVKLLTWSEQLEKLSVAAQPKD